MTENRTSFFIFFLLCSCGCSVGHAELRTERFGRDAPAVPPLLLNGDEALDGCLALESLVVVPRSTEELLTARFHATAFESYRDRFREHRENGVPVLVREVCGAAAVHSTFAIIFADLPFAGISRRGADGRDEQIARPTRGRLLRGRPHSFVTQHRRHDLHRVARRGLLDLDLDLHILVQEEDRDHGHSEEQETDDGHPRPVRGRRGLDVGDLLVDLSQHRTHTIDLALDGLDAVEPTLQRTDVLADLVAHRGDVALEAVLLAEVLDDRGFETLDRCCRSRLHLSHGLGDRVRDESSDVAQLGVGRLELALDRVLLLLHVVGVRSPAADGLVLLFRDLADEDLVLFGETRGGEHQQRVVVVEEREVGLAALALLDELELGVDLDGRLLVLLTLVGLRVRLTTHHMDGSHLDDVGLVLVGLDLTLSLLGLGFGLDLDRVVLVGLLDGLQFRDSLRLGIGAILHGSAFLLAITVNHDVPLVCAPHKGQGCFLTSSIVMSLSALTIHPNG